MIFEYQSKLFFCFYPRYPTAVRFWRRKDTAFFIPANFFRKIVGVFLKKPLSHLLSHLCLKEQPSFLKAGAKVSNLFEDAKRLCCF